MIGGKKKKAVPVTRTPHIDRQQQSTFHYSSNRSAADRTKRSSSNGEQASQAARAKPTGIRLPLSYAAGLLVIGLVAIYASVLSAEPKFVVANDQQPLRSSDTYNTAAKNSIGNGPLSKFKLTINRQKIANDLQAQFPELTKISVTTPVFSRSVQIGTAASQPAAVLNTTTGDYLLDSQGVALFDIAKNRLAVQTDKLTIINDQTGIPIQVGKPALASTQINFAREIKRQADAKQLPVESMTLSAGGGELTVKHQDLKYLIKYNLYEDPRKSFGTFITTREYIERTKVVPTEYIDVRVTERAYVK